MQKKAWLKGITMHNRETLVERKQCNLCSLAGDNKRMVLGEGDLQASLMFVGEAPGAFEDALGKPFVGDAGRILNTIFSKVGIDRKSVYITNTCKCRPPQNRTPSYDEISTCVENYLKQEISLVKPAVIVPLGNTAYQGLSCLYKKLPLVDKISSCIGKIILVDDLYVVTAFHPAFFLRQRDPKYKWQMFDAVKKAFILSNALSGKDEFINKVLRMFEGKILNIEVKSPQKRFISSEK